MFEILQRKKTKIDRRGRRNKRGNGFAENEKKRGGGRLVRWNCKDKEEREIAVGRNGKGDRGFGHFVGIIRKR